MRARDGQIELTVLFAVLCNARRRGLGVRREGLFMKRRLIAFICALAISLCGLGGFAAAYAADDTGAGMKFTVMLSQDHMYDSVGRTLEEKFPGAEFEFITTRTGADTILMQAHSANSIIDRVSPICGKADCGFFGERNCFGNSFRFSSVHALSITYF